jgi:hypothetical protein
MAGPHRYTPLIYRYRNTNYNNLSAALNVSGFPFSDIRLGIAQADEIEEYEIEVLRNLQDTTLKDSLLIPLDGLFGIVGGDGTESISLSIPQLSREDLLTAEIIESGSTLRLRRVSEETGTVAVFLKAEYKNAIMYQLFEVSVLHPTLVHPPQASMMQLYPNPVGHLLTLQGRDLPYYSSVSIHDITGKIIQIIPVKNVKYMIRIDTSEYHHGIYLLTLSGSDKLENRTLKFIVGKS